jgi:alkylated DNA repair dioxygenase AlkB
VPHDHEEIVVPFHSTDSPNGAKCTKGDANRGIEHTFVTMRQMGLFVTADQPTVLVGDQGDVTLVPEFLDPGLGHVLFRELRGSTTWEAESRVMYGRRVLVPRETAARGLGANQPWTPTLLRVRALVEAHAGCAFDYVFINRYRDGNDSVAWHGDHDGEADPHVVVASLSLGAARTFELRPKKVSGLTHDKISVVLGHGDLVVMAGLTQRHWEHRVPKEARITGERINLTFRQRVGGITAQETESRSRESQPDAVPIENLEIAHPLYHGASVTV